MAVSERFDLRLSEGDRRRLRALADLSQRNEADVVRFLIRSAQPAPYGGINLPALGEAEASEAKAVTRHATAA